MISLITYHRKSINLHCIAALFTLLLVDSSYLCSNNDDRNNVIELPAMGLCTCAPGYFLVSRSLDAASAKWVCEPCPAGFFKKDNGVQHCKPCESDYEWSGIAATECNTCPTTNLLTAETRHKICVPCPVSMLTLITYTAMQYIENDNALNLTPSLMARLNVQNMASFQSEFFINQTLCQSTEMVRNVQHILARRTVCPPGSRTVVERVVQFDTDDVDTKCVGCEVGTYNSFFGAPFCLNVTSCFNAMYWDATGIDWQQTGRMQNSDCQYDWNATLEAAGFYPRITGDVQFLFNSPRHIQFGGSYMQCRTTTSTSLAKCGDNAIFPGALSEKCEHDFIGAWQAGEILVSGLMSMPTACQYRCARNHYLSDGLCVRCSQGKFKNADMTEKQVCPLCDAGKHMSSQDGATCVACGAETFSSEDGTACLAECKPLVTYSSSHYCTRMVRSYLIILPVALQTRRVNVETCPGAVIASQTMYMGYGEHFCRDSDDCEQHEIWRNGMCVTCTMIENVQSTPSFNYQCFPLCKENYFAARSDVAVVTRTSVDPPYICRACHASLEMFRAQQCGAAFYISETCIVANTMNPCVPCRAGTFQIHDAASVALTAFRQEDRCIFKCRDAEIVQGKLWYYLSVVEIADMMGISEVQLRNQLNSTTFSNVECIRAEVHTKYNCVDDNLDLLVNFRGTYNELVPWPTASCRGGAQRFCSEKNGVEIRVNNVEERYECHCKSGYYGEYSSVVPGANTLIRCLFCPTYGESFKGTRDIRGCFCRAGTFRDANASSQMNGDDGLVCIPCDSNVMYCPGGPHSPTIFQYVSQTVARQQALLIYDQKTSEAGGRLPCPVNTSTRHAFANSEASCLTDNDMRYDAALGYYVFCDNDRHHSSSNITQWLEAKSRPCNRRCYPPLSIEETGTRNCRCNAAKGYSLIKFVDAEVGKRRERAMCACKPGWYSLDDSIECIPCPKNSFCDGRKRTPCDVQFTSSMFSKSEIECVCPAGFYFVVQSNACRLCQSSYKCPGGRDAIFSSQLCSTEEMCNSAGIYVPKACPRGSTKQNLYSTAFPTYGQCESQGILTANTAINSERPNLVVLFANEVQQDTRTVITQYGVQNPSLLDLCVDSSFNLSLSNALRGGALMPISGFFGTFQWLCGAERVLVRLQTHTENRNPSSLKGAFLCAQAPIMTIHATVYHHTRQSFLMHSGLSVVGAHSMGYDGFIAESYHDMRLSISDPNTHLVWNIFLACPMRTQEVGVSEVDTCEQCDASTNGGFVVLGSM